jgi:hypothetical protein
MYKIFKYPAGYEKGKLYYFGLKGKVLRTGWVEDTTYKGYWVWVIVDPESKDYEKIFVEEVDPWIPEEFCSEWVELGVLEEQEIKLYENTVFDGIRVYKGKIKLGCNYCTGQMETFKIIGCKTGQELKYHPNDLEYLGFASLVIKDEIAIYFFRVFE